MELQHLAVKIPVEDPAGVDLAAFIPVFHRWIQAQHGEGLLLDVADYRHVPGGPGVMLIGHEADYAMDTADGRLGFRYSRKAALPGSNADRLRQALRALLTACRRVEDDPTLAGAVRFNRREVELAVTDRLLAPNTAESFAEVAPELRDFFTSAFSLDDVTLHHLDDPRRLFAVRVQVPRPLDEAGL